MSDRWLYGWAVGYAAVGAASLLVPLYVLSLGGSALVVGLLAASAAFAGVPGALLWGRLAARTGRRRPFLLVALAASTGTLAVMPLLSSAWLVLAVNAVLWFVISAAAPVLNLVVVTGVPEPEWEARIGRLNAFQGYGWVAGLVGGLGWTAVAPALGLSPLAAQRWLLLALAGTAGLATLLVRLWYPERATVTSRRFEQVYRRFERRGIGAGRVVRTVTFGPTRMYWSLRTLRPSRIRGALRRPIRRYLLSVALFSVGFGVFWGPMPAFLGEGGLGDGTVFALFLLGSIGSAVFYERVGLLSARVGPARAQALALGARVVLFPLVGLLGVAAGVALLGFGFAVIGVSWAVIAVTATALVGRLTAAHERAEAFGLYAALSGLGTGLGSALGGALAGGFGYGPTFVAGGAAVLLGLGGVLAADAVTEEPRPADSPA